jgi:hypothetical protein
MKRALPVLLLVCALAAPVIAGDIPIPPAPPSCTENCPKQATSSSPIPPEIILLLITLIPRL